ncbi:LOW QUALITY PROTEIN: hypothetical protein PHMEG_00015947 [Phytophthora megakarya]|uniref:MULE transposase domain-containing protein n=1 Tax=Phytophthora megakarya TaxID=4795 RepID=A0A225W0H5_9STRA|nr:LOW QUALITY PROTEIN: hypothetical protein PHMEG_00015947 [Phytophthora megakarya]
MFRCVPRGYKQCIIVMLHDRATGMFVPVYYVLSTSREKRAYWNIVHFIAQGTDQQIEPAEIVCDFEPALQNALQVQFPNAIVIGCLFHLKQALRRAMKRFAIPDVECTIEMTRGVLNVLTVIAHDQVELGTKWVKQEIRRRCSATGVYYSKGKWRGFWGYFSRSWLEQFGVEVWNVHGLDNELVACTNNTLERYNRELTNRIPTHPSMTSFRIKTLSAESVGRLADIPRVRARRMTREVIQLTMPVEIPPDIEDDSDGDEPVALEQASDGSSDEVQATLGITL